MLTRFVTKSLSFCVYTAAMLLACHPASAADASRAEGDVERWGLLELEFPGPAEGNPYVGVQFAARFEREGESIRVPGFYDGEGVYRVRFSPPAEGRWTFMTQSNVAELEDHRGSFRCVGPTGDNHGPVKVVNRYALQYADGNPFYAVGTTAYQWTSVDQDIQQQTLKTLAEAPFNKIRMCFFPKSYRFGNDTEPWAHPFQRSGEQADFNRPNFAFFQNFDRRVRQLGELGIQADVILFHPYDRWGYERMGREHDDRYLRYLIARLSAFRNVWWSMANEYDLMIDRKVKTLGDFERFLQICQREDPHQRLRGIHNWYNTEDHFFDHRRPEITHASLQTSDFFKAIEWRERYGKPLLFDEMRYEGDVPAGWGNLTAEEMTSYFWMAGLSGGYGTHGDTFDNAAGPAEVRWWAKGGRLVGRSPERIAFFREILRQAPVHAMVPQIMPAVKPSSLADSVYILAKPGEMYLAYAVKAGQPIRLDLPPGSTYRVEVLDTWNRKITRLANARPGDFRYTTTGKYQALRVTRETGRS